MLLLRAVTRLVTFLLLLALAAAGLALAVFSIDEGGNRLSLPALARHAHLSQLRHDVGRFLDALDASGPVAKLSALGGLGAMAVGVLLLVGVLRSRRDRLALLAADEQGVLAARRRPLGQAASALVEQIRGITDTRARVRPRRRGRGGRLVVRINRPRGAASDETAKQRAESALAPLTEPFGLRSRVRVRHGRGEAGEG